MDPPRKIGKVKESEDFLMYTSRSVYKENHSHFTKYQFKHNYYLNAWSTSDLMHPITTLLL